MAFHCAVVSRVVLFEREPGPGVPVSVRVRGGVAGLAHWCLFTVRDRTCVGSWAGAAPSDSFKTVDRVTVCDWVGHISINAYSKGHQDSRAYNDAYSKGCQDSRAYNDGRWCNPRVTFDGKVRNLGPRDKCPQIRFPPTVFLSYTCGRRGAT